MAKIFECVIVELLSIVKDDDPRDSEVVNDTLPDKASEIFLCDSGQWFCLNPFYEVVDPYNKELELLYCHREGSYYVQPLLGEQPVGAHWCKFLQWLSYDVAEVLALVTRLHVGLGVLLHCRPIVSCLYQFVNQASMPSSDSYILLRGLL